MPKKEKKAEVKAADNHVAEETPFKGRLRRLVVKNFRAIGSPGVDMHLDDIVVLVGPNNCGKSSILRAYEVIMQDGSTKGHLKEDDFPNSKVDAEALPEIELYTEVVEGEPGKKWINLDPGSGKKTVRERWVWAAPGAGIRPQSQQIE